MRRVRMLVAVIALLALGAVPAAAVQGPWKLPATTISAGDENAGPVAVAIARDGTATALWAGTPQGGRTTLRAADRPPGGAFAASATVGVAAGIPADAHVGVAADGTTVVAWSETGPSGGVAVKAALRRPGGAFSAPVDLNGAGGPSVEPRIDLAVGPDGTAVVVWAAAAAGSRTRIRAAVRAPGGQFAPAAYLTDGQVDTSPRAGVAADGTATVVFETRFDAPSRVAIRAVTRPPAGAFGAPVEVGEGNWPDIAVAPDGTAVVTWSGARALAAAVRPPRAAFGAPVAITGSVPAGASQAVAAGADGTVAAVWVDGGSVEVSVRPRGGVFSGATDVSSSLASPSPVRSPATSGPVPPRRPAIAVGPDGTTTAVWEHPVGAGYVVRAATRPAGRAFAPSRTLSGPNAVTPQVAVGPDGAAVGVWLDLTGRVVTAKAVSTDAPSAQGCGARVRLGRAIVEGALDETGPGTGVFRVRSPGIAYVGGFQLRPRPGGSLVVDTGAGTLAEQGAGVDVLFEKRVVPLSIASIPLQLPSATIAFNRAGSLMRTLFSLPVSGSATVAWADGGAATTFEMELEAEKLLGRFGTFPAGARAPSARLRARLVNCTGFQLTGAEVSAAELSFVPRALRVPKKLGLKNVLLEYEDDNGVDTWTGQAEVILPIARQGQAAGAAPDFSVGGKLVVRNSELASVGLAVSGINKELALRLFLQRITGDVVMKPAFGGGVGIEATLGPVVVVNGEEQKLVKLDGNLKLFESAAGDCPAGPNPVALTGTGSIPVVQTLGAGSVKLTDRACLYATSQAIEKTMEVEAELGDVVDGSVPRPVAVLRSSMRGFAGAAGIELEGASTLTIPVIGPLAGRALISSSAIAACAQISFFSGGVVHRWTDRSTQTFTGCDLAPWRVGIAPSSRSAQGRNAVGESRVHMVQVRAGLPFLGLSVQGAEAPPAIEVTGPGGARFVSDGVKATIRADVVIVPVTAERRTYAFVRAPVAGAWRITALGTQPLSRFASTSGLPKPQVSGTVRRAGRGLILRYRVRPIAGQTVVFRERTKDGVVRTIGTARGAAGTIGFRPASTGQQARIEALVTQDGLPRAVVRVGSFTSRLSVPTGLRARRTARDLSVTWARDPRAVGYRIVIRSGAARVLRTDTTVPRLDVRGIPAGRLRVTVVARPPVGPLSPPAAITVPGRS